ncbi:MAG: M23 family metallopeptidase [Spirochaetales bacterium]|nr:M23 family metallopeptidase [Spirochaetales bacterium]
MSRFFYAATVWFDRLGKRYRKAWTGLSVLVLLEDSARPPHNFRINYLIVLFSLFMVCGLPVLALWATVSSYLSYQRFGDNIIETRMKLLREVSALNREKTAHYGTVVAHNNALQALANRFQDYQGEFESQAAEEVRGAYDSMTLEANRMLMLRTGLARLVEYFPQRMNFLEHRLMIHALMPRGIPLRSKDLIYIGKWGWRINPVTKEETEFHEGVDLIASTGKEVLAAGPGKVIEVDNESDSGYGLYVRIHHGLGYTSLYAHNSENLVKVGDYVNRGQVIAKVGDTGRTVGAHLHYEIKLGPQFELESPWGKRRSEDPVEYLELQ